MRAPDLDTEAFEAPVRPRWTRWLTALKILIGLALIAALLHWGQIDMRALKGLADAPGIILLATALIFSTLIFSTLRWALLLRLMEIPIPVVRVYHFMSIGFLFNTFLVGSVGADAIRLLYGWRYLRRGGARLALSVLVDRVFGLLAVIFIAAVAAALSWPRIASVPILATLALTVWIVLATGVLGAGLVLAAPRLVQRVARALAGFPWLAGLLEQASDAILAFRRSPSTLTLALLLALLTQVANVAAVLVLAGQLQIGSLTALDLTFATPLAFVVNTIPLTPNGLGVGEAAFDQICHLLETVPSTAAYSSIFFAFRGISALASSCGLVSLFLYRNRSLSENS